MDSAAADPFFLDWGSSVNVNEDLRRSIRTEIEHIDANTTTLQASIQAEEKTQEQIDKDFTHAQDEMMTLSRYSTEEKENSSMNKQIQGRLRDTMSAEVLAVVTPTRDTASVQNTQDEFEQPNENAIDNATNNEITTSPIEKDLSRYKSLNETERSLVEMISFSNSQLNQYMSALKQDRLQCRRHESDILAKQHEMNTIDSRIAGDRKTLDSFSADADAQSRLLEEEMQRVKKVKSSTQTARRHGANNAKMITKHTKALSTNETSHRQVENKRHSDLRAALDSTNMSESDIARSGESKRVRLNTLDELKKQFQHLASLQGLRNECRGNLDEAKKRNHAIKESESNLLRQEKQSRDELKSVVSEVCLDATRLHDEVMVQKQNNDKNESCKVSHISELSRISEERDAWVIKATEIDRKITVHKQGAEAERLSNELRYKEIGDNQKDVQGRFEKSIKDFDSMKVFQDEEAKDTQSDVEECQALVANFQEATDAQRTKLREEKMRSEKAWQSKLLEKKKSIDEERHAEVMKLETLRQMISLMSSTEKAETDLLHDAVVVDEVDGKAIIV